MPGRSWSDASREYRYGFNGKEKDFETANNNYDFGARIYDGRLGRWLSLDPLMGKFIDITPYAGMSNSPILIIDLDGEIIRIKNGTVTLEYRNGKLYSSDLSGNYTIEFVPTGNEYAKKALDALNILNTTQIGLKLINELVIKSEVVTISDFDGTHNDDKYIYDNNTLYTDFSDEKYPTQYFSNKVYQTTPGYIVLAHELAHTYDDFIGLAYSNMLWFDDIYQREIFACHIENKVRAEVGLRLRTYYDADEFQSPIRLSKVLNSDGTSNYYEVENETSIFVPNDYNQSYETGELYTEITVKDEFVSYDYDKLKGDTNLNDKKK